MTTFTFDILHLITLALIGLALVASRIHHQRTDVRIGRRRATARYRRLPTRRLELIKARYDAALVRQRRPTLPITVYSALMGELATRPDRR